MKRILVALLLLTVFVGIGNSKNFSVVGVVVDSLENEPVPYATLRVDKHGGTEPTLGISGVDGAFDEKLAEPGVYTLTVSGTGMRQRSIEFAVGDTARVCNLGRVALVSGVELEEVSVVAQKPLVKADIDKITYRVEDDPEALSKTAIQMLRKVPMVTVDGQDNITVKGSSNFKVYVNGKPNTMMSNNPKEVLRSLPASSVKSIEVITDPGAKYDAEGVGGIINIVTQGSRMQGYNLSAGLTGSNKGPSAYAYGSVQVGKFTMSGNYSYSYESRNNSSSSDYERDDYDSDGRVKQTLRSVSRADGSRSQMHYGSLSGSYEADSLNLVTFSYDFYTWRDNSHGTSSFVMLDAAQVPVYSYNTLDKSLFKYGSHSVGVDYQHSFKKKDELLTVSYKFDKSPRRTQTETTYSDVVSVPFITYAQGQDNKSHTAEHTVQVDYVNPINEHHYVDAGMKFIARKNASDSQTLLLEQVDGSLPSDEDSSVDYSQRQNIVAAYADYNLKIQKFGFKTGVRYEHTFMNVEYERHPDRNFSKNFDDVVPSAAISYGLSEMSNIRVGYNMRLNRPGISFLNPFRISATPNDVSYGNPDLSTEKSHSISLSYNIFTSKVNLNADARYSFVNNGVTGYSFVDEDGVRNSTYGNYVRTQRTSLSVWMSWNITDKTSFMLSASGSYVDLRSKELGSSNSGFGGSLYAQLQQRLPWKLDFTAYCGYGAPYISLQGRSGSYNFYGLSLNRSFLKEDRMEVSLFASDFFSAWKKYSSTTVTDTYRQLSHYKGYECRFGVSLSWRFGSMNVNVKRTERSIINDDVMKGGGNGSGGQQKN